MRLNMFYDELDPENALRWGTWRGGSHGDIEEFSFASVFSGNSLCDGCTLTEVVKYPGSLMA
jgi:hypothetical protein